MHRTRVGPSAAIRLLKSFQIIVDMRPVVFMAHDQFDGPFRAAERPGALGAETGMMHAEMETVEQPRRRRRGEAREQAR